MNHGLEPGKNTNLLSLQVCLLNLLDWLNIDLLWDGWLLHDVMTRLCLSQHGRPRLPKTRSDIWSLMELVGWCWWPNRGSENDNLT